MRRHTLRPAVTLIAACLLPGAACSPGETARQATPTGQTHVYRCGDGYRFVVRFEPQRAWVFLDDTVVSVPQVPTRRGLHYTNGRITFTSDGREARLKLDDGDHTGCQQQLGEADRR